MLAPCQGSGVQLKAGTPAGRPCRVKIELAALSGHGFCSASDTVELSGSPARLRQVRARHSAYATAARRGRAAEAGAAPGADPGARCRGGAGSGSGPSRPAPLGQPRRHLSAGGTKRGGAVRRPNAARPPRLSPAVNDSPGGETSKDRSPGPPPPGHNSGGAAGGGGLEG